MNILFVRLECEKLLDLFIHKHQTNAKKYRTDKGSNLVVCNGERRLYARTTTPGGFKNEDFRFG